MVSIPATLSRLPGAVTASEPHHLPGLPLRCRTTTSLWARGMRRRPWRIRRAPTRTAPCRRRLPPGTRVPAAKYGEALHRRSIRGRHALQRGSTHGAACLGAPSREPARVYLAWW
jgi:hypothetical protein